MFGHDDNKKMDDVAEPAHDAVLDDTATTVHPNDSAVSDNSFAEDSNDSSPAFIAGPPVPADSDDDKVDTPKEDTPDLTDSATPAADHDLLDIKQSALKQLTPLVGHLNQTPEEKFRTTMMMIQASDDQTLVKDAYEAAQAIPDEKVKAQALLDIVNEINYFTQHNS